MGAVTTALSPTLFTIEDDLQALLNSEDLVDEDQLEAFKVALAEKLKSAVDKRQRLGEFIRFCELMQSNCEAEITRLESLKKSYTAAQARAEDFLVYAIEQLGTDARGRYPKLAGHTLTLSVTRNPDSVDIIDQKALPDEFRSVEVKIPALAWKQVLESFDRRKDPEGQNTAAVLHSADEAATRSISKVAVRDQLKAGGEVPGADLKIGNLRCKVS